ncbi:uncharacterized protein PgNI_12575 [Pyricularia grisea]|uniref:Uncharacterized protein n=1 Tax=Pyricularia grisea TaxID=148305 RepID=A0A6P8AM28_PYRGI|nr:uncharacterized protein PgNI_12575 [Pyricularia grisea]TLD03088.1 hypothetical protein PgNI_12575 [Pyricularia grisea]
MAAKQNRRNLYPRPVLTASVAAKSSPSGRGCRLGWITASPTVCQHLFSIVDDTTQQPSDFVQVVIARLLSEPDGDDANGSSSRTSWGFQGWVGWLQGLRSAYRRRMVKMATVLERGKHVSTASTTNGGGEDNKVAMFDVRWPMGGLRK